MSHAPSILQKYPDYEAVIGIEVHMQLTTESKIFCPCPNQAGSDPNTNICPICTGHPGVLPVLNQQVIAYAVRAALATNSEIAPVSIFDRKHYFYPDLPKGYQITQQYEPICKNGYIPIRTEDGTIKKIRLHRIHIEEDAGKNIHSSASNESFVDLNRAGTPLLEIVSCPDISTAGQAKAYLKMLRLIGQYLNICSGNMEEGAFRADTNISVRKKGSAQLGTKCELKNINSFKFIGDAIEYEIERQIELLESEDSVRQETRLWDTRKRQTVVMRTKEEAADYRYFEDPDLPHIAICSEMIEQVRQDLPELPYERFERLMNQYGLSAYEAEILMDDPELTQYYEAAMKALPHKTIINWVLRDVLGYIKEHEILLPSLKITPEHLAHLVSLVAQGTINNRVAQEVLIEIAQSGSDPRAIVKERGLEQMGSSDELEKIIKTIVDSHPDVVQEYKGGKQKLFGFFVGQAMKQTGGKGNPTLIQELLKKYLE